MPEFNTTLSNLLIHLKKLWLQTCGWLYFQYIMNQWPSLFQCTILRDRVPIQQGEYAKLLLLRRWVQFPLSPVSWETRAWEVSHNSLLSTLSVTFISSALMAQNDICLPKIPKLYFQPQLFLKFQTNISNYLFNISTQLPNRILKFIISKTKLHVSSPFQIPSGKRHQLLGDHLIQSKE